MAVERVNELGGWVAGWRQVEGLWDILTASVSRVGVMVMDLQSGCV